MTAPALLLENFSYFYPGAGSDEGDAEGPPGGGLIDVSLRVEAGEFVLVCGPSGAGKSTLLRLAGGLVPHHFGGTAEGEAFVCGRDLRTHGPARLAAVCGTVMQDPETQVVMGGVWHEIAFPLENLGWNPSAVQRAVAEAAAVLEITHLLDRRTAELSGGELQRVVLAAAIAVRPPLLALDEPLSQLDAEAVSDLPAALARLNAELGITLLVAEHRLEPFLNNADRVIAFERGKPSFDGPPADFEHWVDDGAAPWWPRRVATAVATDVVLPATRASSHAATSVLAMDGVGYRHAGAERPALTGVDLELRPGERVALTGPNGSGKSTLLRIARGLLRPTEGEVETTGSIGLLLQNPNDYLIHERVADEASPEALGRFGLAAFAARDPRDLAGGERQRLALAIVTQDRPAALLLDEPTRGMDGLRRDELIGHLRRLAAAGVAVMVATHDARFIAAFAERVITLARGRVVVDRQNPPSVEAAVDARQIVVAAPLGAAR